MCGPIKGVERKAAGDVIRGKTEKKNHTHNA